ncbi:hypothetical protein DM860_016831 [Cuscuta australis]|uniref:Uncharacterized protein n=1 Tax=Cuscuta australis TaxID=267555 RepID=A0A328CXZ2_9ASTE|nr:hypothetical protein DM860_016831 [Cuscuta australis]
MPQLQPLKLSCDDISSSKQKEFLDTAQSRVVATRRAIEPNGAMYYCMRCSCHILNLSQGSSIVSAPKSVFTLLGIASLEWRLYFCWLYTLRMALAHVLYRTFFSQLAAGSWLFLGYLHHICLIHLALRGWRTLEIGQTGFCIEVELELKEKKVGRLGGMRSWSVLPGLLADNHNALTVASFWAPVFLQQQQQQQQQQ